MPHHSWSDDRRTPPSQPHDVLGLSPREDDAVKVIEVAQVLLRRWRRIPIAPAGGGFEQRVSEARNRIREIVAARQAMLERINARWRPK